MAAAKRIIGLLEFKRFVNPKSQCLLPVFELSRQFGDSVKETFRFSEVQVSCATEAQKMKKPDPSKLLFGDTFSDHMFEVDWNRTSGWGIPKIVPLHHFQFHPGSKIFHYAQALFEGMKAFKSSDGSVNLFRPEQNVDRLLKTAKRAALPLFDADEFLHCLKKLVSIDIDWVPGIAGSSLYIRPTFIGTQNSLGVQSSNTALLYIITCPVGPYFPQNVTKPIALLADPKYTRAWPGGVGDKKMSCNYAPSLYVQQLAQEQGLNQVLWLFGEEHRICEVGAMNVFFLFQKSDNKLELATPALDGTILPGVVRMSLLELARGFKELEVSERSIFMGEVIEAHENNKLLEIFVCGTACCVCPVSLIRYVGKDLQIPTMESENPLYQRLCKALMDVQYGKVESEWLVKVN